MINLIKIRDAQAEMHIYRKNSVSSKKRFPPLFRDGRLPVSWRRSEARLRELAPLSLLFFVIFTMLYVSFVVSRTCGNGTEVGQKGDQFCAGNFLLDSREQTEKLTSAEIFGGAFHFAQNDSRLLDYIQRNHLIPPSILPYNLNGSSKETAEFKGIVQFVRKTLENEGGQLFFVEAGAHDGEYMSNTLTLEKDFGWTGLLIEPDPVAFSKLRQKNRKAWLSNVCLSVTDQPQQVKFHLNKEFPVLARIPSDDNIYEWDDSITEEIEVPCLPLFSILSAINVTTIDFFSLDIEGAELKVLKTIPFDSVFIKIFVIEHMWLIEGRRALVKFMQSKGYNFKRRILYGGNSDSIFIHRDVRHSL